MKKKLISIVMIAAIIASCNKKEEINDPIPVGCTDYQADNHDENAIEDNGSCIYLATSTTGSYSVNENCEGNGDAYYMTLESTTENTELLIKNFAIIFFTKYIDKLMYFYFCMAIQ